MSEQLSPEQRAHDVATFLNLADDGIAQRVITAAIRAAETAAVEAERTRCANEIEASAANFSEDEDPGCVRYDWSMHLAAAIRTPTTEATHG